MRRRSHSYWVGPEIDSESVTYVREAPNTHSQTGLTIDTEPTGLYGDPEEDKPEIPFGFQNC